MAIDEPQGNRLLQKLARSYLCSDVSGNVVVLKPLEEDCLHRGQLHPSIKDRLARVRELAHPRVATLRTVERWEGAACLVWVYLEGETWEDLAATSAEHLLNLISALAVAVDALHENGIVHGSLHGRNVIVRQGTQVWLTHVSPFLYAEVQVDILAVVELIREKISGEVSPRLMPLLDELESGRCTLREFSHQVVELEKNQTDAEDRPVEKSRGYRLSSLLMATAAMGMALAIWLAIRHFEFRPMVPTATTFPSLRH